MLIPQGRSVRTAHCFETFDWRLWEAGQVLLSTSRPFLLQLESIAYFETLAREPLRVRSTCSWRDLPAGALRERLGAVCGPRVLLPMGVFRELRRNWVLQDDTQRTVGRLVLSRAAAVQGKTSGPARTVLHVIPVKGQARAARKVDRCLQAAGAKPCEQRAHAALPAFASVRREPGDYTAKPVAQITHEMTAREAAQSIQRGYLTVMLRNLPGVLDDLDPEFLHDFRVALRSSRSALSLLQGVFPPADEARFRRELAAVQRATGPLRDLDVHLLEYEAFKDLLPRELHPGIEGLLDVLTRDRAGALKACHALLRQDTTRALWREWKAFIEKPVVDAVAMPPRALEPAWKVGRHLIRKRFRRLLLAGRAIPPEAPDSAWHTLRIRVKKVRYGLDCFGALLPEKDLALLGDRLRALQNALGRYNDLCQQEAWVRAALQSAIEEQAPRQRQVAALGGLLTALRGARLQQHERLMPAFQRLDAPKVRRAVRRCLARFSHKLA